MLPRSVEVLKIIAKVLAFDDEQLIAVGLKVPPIDIFGAILSTVIGKPAPPPDVEVIMFYSFRSWGLFLFVFLIVNSVQYAAISMCAFPG